MKIIIDKNEFEIKNCIRFKDRFLGLMFKKNINEYLLFENCNSIHTFFMFDEIDVLFLDDKNNIIKKINNLKPWRICICKNSKKVIELPKNTLKSKIKIVD